MRSFFSRIYQMFLRSSRKKQIVLSVWLAHFLLLCFLLTSHFFTRSRPIGRPIAVRTLQETPKVKEQPKASKTLAPKPQKTAAPQPKKTSPKITPSPPAPKKPSEEQKSALHDIKNALSELGQLEKKQEAPLLVPETIHLVSAEKENPFSSSYREMLASYLQEALDLPEYGAVKIKLCIDREGKLLESEIISSENRKNSEFLKNRLQGLTFPCFNDSDVRENSLTFTISFRNAEL